MELSERFTFITGFHYEWNSWTSRLAGDERNGGHENVYQGEAILAYRVSEALEAYTGEQYSSRKVSCESFAASNFYGGLSLTAKF